MKRETPEYNALMQLSAAVGADPALVQGAGGNTSIKQNGILWIKASGTWLMNAMRQDIMVPVALKPLTEALQSNNSAAEKAQSFVVAEQNPADLRPSIETTVHAVFPQTVVVHVHCVETIAVASRKDATQLLPHLLPDFNWRYVPYTKPGISLSRSIAKTLYRDGTPADVVVLGNHGLVVAAASVAEANDLLKRVCIALKQPVRRMLSGDLASLATLAAGTDYELPNDALAHSIAIDDTAVEIAGGGSMYPDHVIFLGEGSVIASQNETPDKIAERYGARNKPAPVSIVYPGAGVLMKQGCGDGAHAMARCLSDITVRLPNREAVNFLTAEQNYELLNWDAEKYRQTLNSKDQVLESTETNG